MCTCSLGTRTLPCIVGLHGSHVGWQEQYNFSPLGNEIYFHAKICLFSCYPTWLTCKPSTLYKSHKGNHMHKVLAKDLNTVIRFCYGHRGETRRNRFQFRRHKEKNTQDFRSVYFSLFSRNSFPYFILVIPYKPLYGPPCCLGFL